MQPSAELVNAMLDFLNTVCFNALIIDKVFVWHSAFIVMFSNSYCKIKFLHWERECYFRL